MTIVQLNIYVPREQKAVLAALDRRAKLTGEPKNVLVLRALSEFLEAPGRAPALKSFDLGAGVLPSRTELYQEWR